MNKVINLKEYKEKQLEKKYIEQYIELFGYLQDKIEEKSEITCFVRIKSGGKL